MAPRRRILKRNRSRPPDETGAIGEVHPAKQIRTVHAEETKAATQIQIKAYFKQAVGELTSVYFCADHLNWGQGKVDMKPSELYGNHLVERHLFEATIDCPPGDTLEFKVAWCSVVALKWETGIPGNKNGNRIELIPKDRQSVHQIYLFVPDESMLGANEHHLESEATMRILLAEWSQLEGDFERWHQLVTAVYKGMKAGCLGSNFATVIKEDLASRLALDSTPTSLLMALRFRSLEFMIEDHERESLLEAVGSAVDFLRHDPGKLKALPSGYQEAAVRTLTELQTLLLRSYEPTLPPLPVIRLFQLLCLLKGTTPELCVFQESPNLKVGLQQHFDSLLEPEAWGGHHSNDALRIRVLVAGCHSIGALHPLLKQHASEKEKQELISSLAWRLQNMKTWRARRPDGRPQVGDTCTVLSGKPFQQGLLVKESHDRKRVILQSERGKREFFNEDEVVLICQWVSLEKAAVNEELREALRFAAALQDSEWSGPSSLPLIHTLLDQTCLGEDIATLLVLCKLVCRTSLEHGTSSGQLKTCLGSLKYRLQQLDFEHGERIWGISAVLQSACMISQAAQEVASHHLDVGSALQLLGDQLVEEVLPESVFLAIDMREHLLRHFPSMSSRLQQCCVRKAKAVLTSSRRGGAKINHQARCKSVLGILFEHPEPGCMPYLEELGLEIVTNLRSDIPSSPHPTVLQSVWQVVHQVDAWKYLFELLETCSSDELRSTPVCQIIHGSKQSVEQAFQKFEQGAVLSDELQFFVDFSSALEQLTFLIHRTPTDFRRSMHHWSERVQRCRMVESTYTDFLLRCLSQLRAFRLAEMQSHFNAFVRDRQAGEPVNQWSAYMQAQSLHTDAAWTMEAVRTHTGMLLWQSLGARLSLDELAGNETSQISEKLSKLCQSLREQLGRFVLLCDSESTKNSELLPAAEALQQSAPSPKPLSSHASAVEARREMVEQQKAFSERLQSLAQKEIDEVVRLFPEVRVQKSASEMGTKFGEFLQIMQIRDIVVQLWQLLSEQAVQDILPSVLCAGPEFTALRDLYESVQGFDAEETGASLNRFRAFRQLVPQISDITEQSLRALLACVRAGLLGELRAFASNNDWIPFKNRWLADASGIEEDVVVSFEHVREALHTCVHSDATKPKTVSALLTELSLLCTSDLELLQERTGSITRERTRSGGMEGVHALESVVELLRESSSQFKVLVKPDSILVTAETLQAEANAESKVLPHAELLDLRNKVAMAEIPLEVVEKLQVASLPEMCSDGEVGKLLESEHAVSIMIRNPERRALVVQLFTQVLDGVEEIVDIIVALQTVGHVGFQSGSFVIRPSLESVRGCKANLEEQQRGWLSELERLRLMVPVLHLLLPKQLVRAFNCFKSTRESKQGDNLSELTDAFSVIGDVSQGNVVAAMQEAAASQTELPGALVLVEQLGHVMQDLFRKVGMSSSHTPVHVGPVQKLTMQLSSVAAKRFPFVVMVTPLSSKHGPQLQTLLCHARLGRLPAPFEVFCCTRDTSKADLLAFLQRWAESDTIQSVLGEKRDLAGNGRFLFCIANAETLPYELQSAALSRLSSLQDESSVEFRKRSILTLLLTHTGKSELFSSHFAAHVLHLELKAKDLLAVTNKSLRDRHGDRVKIFRSRHPCSGKTREVRCQVARQGRLYSCLSVDSECRASLSKQIRRVLLDFEAQGCGHRLSLHLSVAHNADLGAFQEVLFALLVTGCLQDSDGTVAAWSLEHELLIEFAVDRQPDRLAAYEAVPMLHAFRTASFPNEVQPTRPRLIPWSESLSEVKEEEDSDYALVHRYLHNFNASKSRRCWQDRAKPHPPLDQVLLEVLRDASNDWAEAESQRHGRSLEFRLFQKVRTMQYLAPQFRRVEVLNSNLFASFKQTDPEYNLMMMAKWLIVQLVVRTSLVVSVSAVDERAESDDYLERFQFLETFSQTRHSYITLHDGEYEILSLEERSILQALLQKYPAKTPHLADLPKFLNPGAISSRAQSLQEGTNQRSEIRKCLVGVKSSRDLVWKLFGCKTPRKLTKLLADLQAGKYDEQDLQEGALLLQELTRTSGAPAVPQSLDKLSLPVAIEKVLRWLQQPTVTVTPEVLIRMLAVEYRLAAGIPVFIMGETGCGKTTMLLFLARMLGRPFFVVNVHGGMSTKDLYEALQPAIQRAQLCAGDERVMVLLDEANAMPDVWAIKMCLCDRICEGRVLPDAISFVCAVNPIRRRNQQFQDAGGAGLECTAYYQKLQGEQGVEHFSEGHANPFQNMVYSVYPLPESILTLVWDFGDPSSMFCTAKEATDSVEERSCFVDPVSDETLNAEGLVEFSLMAELVQEPRLRKDLDSMGDSGTYWKIIRSVIVGVISAAQHFLRFDVYGGDCSVVSLRDISRCIKITLFVKELQSKRAAAEKILPSVKKRVPTPAHVEIRDAFLMSLTLCYALRLNKDWQGRFKFAMIGAWHATRDLFSNIDVNFFACPTPDDFWQPFDGMARFVSGQVRMEQGIARNDAIRENIFAMLVGLCTKIPVFLVGRPGSSKSLSVYLLTSMMSERDHPFWGQFCVIHKKVFQCEPMTTPNSIYQSAEQVARLQKKHWDYSNELSIGALQLEELGVTALSPHNPLMSLHALIDHGVTVEGSQQWIWLCGLSNWKVDAAKMNRGLFVLRGDPTPEDLQMTGEQIILGSKVNLDAGSRAQLNLAMTAVASIMSNSVMRDEVYNRYYGLRDYYALLKFLQEQLTCPHAASSTGGLCNLHNSLTPHMARWAIQRNLSTLPKQDAQKSLEAAMVNALVGAGDGVQAADWELGGRKLCEICVRAEQALYATKQLKPPAICAQDHRLGQPCANASFGSLQHIAWNLQDCDARHLLVITRGNQALELLFSLGLASYERTTVIYGSDFEEDSGDARTLGNLQRIQNCMSAGHLLVLVQCRRLYENLLDMTNQHYLEENGRKYTRLSMQAHSRFFFVHDKFRLIVLTEECDVVALPPPFLNRFEKVELTFDSVMRSEVRFQCLREAILRKFHVEGFDLLSHLVAGFSQETLASLVFNVTRGSLDEMQQMDLAIFRLTSAMSTTAVLQLYTGCVQEVADAVQASSHLRDFIDSLVASYLGDQPHASLKQIFDHASTSFATRTQDIDPDAGVDNSDQMCPWADALGVTVALITEQHPSMWQPHHVRQALPQDMAVRVLPLDQITSDRDIQISLQSFLAPELGENACLLVLCTPSVPIKLLRKALFASTEARRKCLDKHVKLCRHFVVICGLDKTSKGPGMELLLDSNWHWSFCDSICCHGWVSESSSFQHSVDGMLLVEMPFVRAQDDAQDDEGEGERALIAGDGSGIYQISDLIAVRDLVTGLVYPQRVGSSLLDDLKARSDLWQTWFCVAESTKLPVGLAALYKRVEQELAAAASLKGVGWLNAALASSAHSLGISASILSFARQAVTVVMKEILSLLDCNGNLRHAVGHHTALWGSLLECPSIGGAPEAQAFARNVLKPAASVVVRVGQGMKGQNAFTEVQEDADVKVLQHRPKGIAETSFDPVSEVSFPFSYIIVPELFALRGRCSEDQLGARLVEEIAQRFPVLLRLSEEQVMDFAADVALASFPASSKAAQQIAVILCCWSGLGGVSLFLQTLWTNERLLKGVVDIVDGVLPAVAEQMLTALRSSSHSHDDSAMGHNKDVSAALTSSALSEQHPATMVILKYAVQDVFDRTVPSQEAVSCAETLLFREQLARDMFQNAPDDLKAILLLWPAVEYKAHIANELSTLHIAPEVRQEIERHLAEVRATASQTRSLIGACHCLLRSFINLLPTLRSIDDSEKTRHGLGQLLQLMLSVLLPLMDPVEFVDEDCALMGYLLSIFEGESDGLRMSDGQRVEPLMHRAVASVLLPWVFSCHAGQLSQGKVFSAVYIDHLVSQRKRWCNEQATEVHETCMDWLYLQGARQTQETMDIISRTVAPGTHEVFMTRTLLLSSLKVQLQLFVDALRRLVDDPDDADAMNLLQTTATPFFRSLMGFMGEQAPIRKALGLLCDVEVDRYVDELLLFFVRCASQNGMNCETARRLLLEAVEERMLPGELRDRPVMQQFFQAPPDLAEPSPFAVHQGFGEALRNVAVVCSGQSPLNTAGMRDVPQQPQQAWEKRAVVCLAVLHVTLSSAEGKEEELRRLQANLPLHQSELQLRELLGSIFRAGEVLPAELRTWLEESKYAGEVALHFIVLLLSRCDNPPHALELFCRAFNEPQALTAATLPAMIESTDKRMLLGQAAEFHVYQCPNRHTYVTGECHNIASEGRCADCGAPIGGPQYGRLHAGNRYLGTVRKVLQNFDPEQFRCSPGLHPESDDPARTERGLSATQFRTCRFFLRSAVLGQLLTHPKRELQCGETLPQLLHQLSSDLRAIQKLHFADHADDRAAAMFLHQVAARLFANAETLAPSWPMRSQAERLRFEESLMAFADKLPEPTALVRELQTLMEQSMQDATKNRMLNRLRKAPADLGVPEEVWMAVPPATLAQFWAAVDLCKNLPLLCMIRQKAEDLALLEHLPSVVAFLREVHLRYSGRLTREEAKQMKMSQMKEVMEGDGQLQIFEGFKTAFTTVWPFVRQWQCLSFEHLPDYLGLHALPFDDLHLELFLPSTTGDGVVFAALYSKLATTQRALVSEYAHTTRATQVFSLESLPFSCIKQDVVCCRTDEDLLPLVQQHLVRDAGSISFHDLPLLEMRLLKKIRLEEKPLLLADCPPVQYLDEVVQSSMLAEVDKILKQERLPSSVHQTLNTVVAKEAAARPLLLRYVLTLAAMIIQSRTRVDRLLCDFSCEVRLALDEPLRRAEAVFQHAPQLRDSVCLAHIRSLAALLWDGRIHERFDESPSQEQQGRIQDAVARVRSDGHGLWMQSATRELAFEQFSSDTSGGKSDTSQGVSIWLDLLAPDDYNLPEALELLPVSIFGSLLRAVCTQAASPSSPVCDAASVKAATASAAAALEVAAIANPEGGSSEPETSLSHLLAPSTAAPPETALPSSGWSWSGLSVELPPASTVQSASRALSERLERLGLQVDESTPRDGNCLFWALRNAAKTDVAIPELRRECLNAASEEEKEIAGKQYRPVRSASIYDKLMSQDGEWGDELMVVCAARVHHKPVCVVSPAYIRTYFPDGKEQPDFDNTGLIVAFNGQNHYYAVGSLEKEPNKGVAMSA